MSSRTAPGGFAWQPIFGRGDNGAGCLPVFKQDPTTFKPRKNSLGQAQMAYHGGLSKAGRPEEQFVKVLMDRKRVKFAERAQEIAALGRRDVVLEVKLPFPTHPKLAPLTRRIRCSAGTKLSVFQDKILSPVMGWERNLHSYLFVDMEDGAMFGMPKNSNHIDGQHRGMIGDWDRIVDEEFTVAHLISKKGDVCRYIYDLGDRFWHIIEVAEVFEEAESTGETVLLEGSGACPGENMNGNKFYGEKLARFIKGSEVERIKFKKEVLEAPNYQHNGKPIVPLASFNPVHFSIIEGQKRLSLALSSPNSRRDGAKVHQTMFGDGNITTEGLYALLKNAQSDGKRTARQKVTKDGLGGNGAWTEMKSTVADVEAQSSCHVCGKAGGLSKCGGCKRVWYCSADHQKSDWMFHKAACRKVQAAKAKAAAIV